MRIAILSLLSLFLVVGDAHAEGDPHLADLAPFVGKTWRGEFVGSTADKPAVDVQHWEWMLGGVAIRVAHSLNDGEYAGEMILMWDAEAERVIYFYFTTAGFYTTGTMALDEGVYTAHEMVSGDANGVTEVRSSAVMLLDGRMHATSEYLQDGEWVPGREAYYVEDPSAKVIYRDR